MAWMIVVLTLSIGATSDGTVTERTRGLEQIVGDYITLEECEQARERLIQGLGRGLRAVCINYRTGE